MKEIIKLRKDGGVYYEYVSGDTADYQIVGVKYTNGLNTKLFIITNFAEFNIETCVAKINILELYKNDVIEWEVITNPTNKLFPSGQMVISKNYYVNSTTGMPVSVIYDEQGVLLPGLIDNWTFYYNTILEPYILNALANAIMFYIG